jgi:hypothetical protein
MSFRIVGLVISIPAVSAGCAAIYLSTFNSALNAYNSAPRCASLGEAEAGKDCRISEPATITQVRRDGDTADIYFGLPGPYIPSSPARLPAGVVVSGTVAVGAEVPIEVWGYRVTKIAGVTTADNPENDPRPVNLRITGALLAVLGCATALALMMWRRFPASSPDMSPIAVSDAIWR